MSEYNQSSVEYENQCKKWHNDLVQDFEINNTKNLEKRLDEIENIVNEICFKYSSSNDHVITVLDDDIDDINTFNHFNFKIERNERSRLTKLCNANIREYTTVSVPKCTGPMSTIDDYKKKARNKLNRWKPKFYGDYVLFQIIFINIYNHCYTIGMYHGWSDSEILQLFVKIFHKLLDSKIRFEKTRDVPLILTTAFSTNTKFRASCEHFLTHCKLYGSWKDKTGSAKARCDSFKKCLETIMGIGCNNNNNKPYINIILPPPIIIDRMDIQENNRKCSGGYRYLIREIIEKLEDREGCRKDAGERISECGNNQIIEIIQEYHHYNLRFWTVTPEKPQRHRHRYNRSSLMSYTPKLRHSGHNDDDGDYQISTTNAQSTYNNNYMPISIDNPGTGNSDNYSFNDAYNDYNNNVPPKVNLSLDNIYDNTRSQYVDNRTHTKPGIIPLRIMTSIGGSSSISDMSQSSTPTTTSHRSTNTAASIPKGINVNGVNSNRSMKYSPIRSQSPYHSPRHNPLHGQGAGTHRGLSKVIKSQRLQPQIPQIMNIRNSQHQRPSFSRMSSADSSIPDMDRLPGLPIDAGNLCTIKSGQEMDDEEDVDIPVISTQNLRYQQIPMVCLDNNGDHRPFQSGSILNNHPNITRDLPAPPRAVMNNNNINGFELQSRNGVRHLSQELPMPKQQCMSHQRGMMGIMNQNYNPPSFDMDFNHNQFNHSHNNNNGNIVFNQNNTINFNFNNPQQNQAQDMLTSGTLHHSTVTYHRTNNNNNNADHNNTQELHQQSQSNSQQFTFPTAKSTSNWYAKWNSKSNNNNNNTSNDFNNNNNFNGNNQNGSDSKTEQRQFDITNNFDHTQLNSSNYDNCVIPSNVQQFTQFDHNQYTNNEAMHHRTAPNIIYGNTVNDNNGSSGYNNDNYHNLNNNNNSNMINDSNTFLFSGRNSQRMQLHNFGSYN